MGDEETCVSLLVRSRIKTRPPVCVSRSTVSTALQDIPEAVDERIEELPVESPRCASLEY